MSYTGCTHADWLTGGWTEYYTGYTKQPSIPIQNTQSIRDIRYMKITTRKFHITRLMEIHSRFPGTIVH